MIYDFMPRPQALPTLHTTLGGPRDEATYYIRYIILTPQVGVNEGHGNESSS